MISQRNLISRAMLIEIVTKVGKRGFKIKLYYTYNKTHGIYNDKPFIFHARQTYLAILYLLFLDRIFAI